MVATSIAPASAAGPAHLIKDVNPDAAGSGANPLVSANGSLFVSACRGDGLRAIYAIDAPTDTPRVLTIAGPCEATAVWWAIDVGDRVFFTLEPGWTDLWVSDGTPDGTSVVANLGVSGEFDAIAAVDGTLYLAARAVGTGGMELWKSDGTPDGTVQVRDIAPGELSSDPQQLTAMDGRLFFSGWNQVRRPRAVGERRHTGRDRGGQEHQPGRKLVARETHSDGRVSSTSPPPTGRAAASCGGRMAPRRGPNASRASGPGQVRRDPRDLTVVDHTLFFTATDGTHGRELWKSDGTAAGTALVKDIRSGSSSPRDLARVGSHLVLSADMGDGDHDLWRSDGTAAGTRRIAEVSPSHDDEMSAMATIGDTLLFGADGPGGVELWRTTGTATGTSRVDDINPSGDSNPSGFGVFDGRVWFGADDGAHGRELWASDGTSSNTGLVADFDTSTEDSDPYNAMAVGRTVYFSGDDGRHGRELWMTDGSAAGTEMVRDIRPGHASSDPATLGAVGGRMTSSRPTSATTATSCGSAMGPRPGPAS